VQRANTEPEGIETCITCGDVGVPMQVVRLDSASGLALCATETGEHSDVEVALVAPVAEGDALLVHAGTAIARLEESPAGGGALGR